MIYVMSDLHGQYDKYRKMLDKIKFKDSDTLFLIGNICDIGEKPCAILLDTMMRANVYPIIGKSDYTALRMLSGMNDEKVKADPSFRSAFTKWISRGGVTTATEFRQLDEDSQTDILDYIRDEFVAYDEITVAGTNYIMVSTGVPEKDCDLDNMDIEELLDNIPDFSFEPYEDSVVISGAIPTYEHDEDYRGTIYRRNGQIGINTAPYEGEPLGCLCLDTGKEYYV